MTPTLFILSFFITNGFALMCYECDDVITSSCTAPSRNLAVNCEHSKSIPNNHEGLEYQCVAYVDRLKINNSTRLTRRCATKNSDSFCDYHSSAGVYEGFTVDSCSTCREDYCNSNGSPSAIFLSSFILTMLTLCLYTIK